MGRVSRGGERGAQPTSPRAPHPLPASAEMGTAACSQAGAKEVTACINQSDAEALFN